MKKISLLVSTVDLNFQENKSFAQNIDFSICEVIVIQQQIHSNELLSLAFEAHIVSYKEKGLAKSRNRAIEHATCPIALICDDDVQFLKGFEQDILAAYEEFPNAALISFKIQDESGLPYKTYLEANQSHSFRSIMRVNSIETSIQVNKLGSIQPYDERFGLGASCPTGEDTIFAIDCYKAGLLCIYVNKTIVVHPLESSGKIFNVDYPFYRGQLYRRAFGWLGIPFGIFFAIKKYKLYRTDLGFISFVIKFLKGFITPVPKLFLLACQSLLL
jgi:GT2 family glycosyltransferase